MIYVPLYLVLNYVEMFQSFASTHSNYMHLMALTCHVLAGILYLLPMVLYEKLINRWIILTKCPFKETIEYNGDESINNSPSERSKDEQFLKNRCKESKPSGRVDVIRPNLTFMEENKLEANKLLERKRFRNIRKIDEH